MELEERSAPCPIKRPLQDLGPHSRKKQRLEPGSLIETETQTSTPSSETQSPAATKRWLRSLSRAERLLTKEPETQLSRLEALQVKSQAEGRGIDDEELFEHGELEQLMRSEQEVTILRKTNGWDETPHDLPQARQNALDGPQNSLHMKHDPTAVGQAPSCAGDVVEIEEWRPLSPTMHSTSFLPEEFDDW